MSIEVERGTLLPAGTIIEIRSAGPIREEAQGMYLELQKEIIWNDHARCINSKIVKGRERWSKDTINHTVHMSSIIPDKVISIPGKPSNKSLTHVLDRVDD